MEQSKFVFTGVLLKENSSISALCLEVDVATEGETIQEAKNNLIEAVSLYIESAVENNLPVLRPVPEEENPLLQNHKKILEKFTLKINFTVYAHA
jgi:predicted RNase H-like HicB family nuclease